MRNGLVLKVALGALGTIALASITRVDDDAIERRDHQEFPAKSGRTLTLKTFGGEVDIQTQNQEKVIYDGQVRAGGEHDNDLIDLIEFDYGNTDGDVVITMKWKNERSPRNSHLKIRHTLIIPMQYNVEVRTGGGSITAKDLHGVVKAHTSGGSIVLGNTRGDLEAHTTGGDVIVGDIKGAAKIGTSGGKIKIGTVSGQLVAQTTGGSINATMTRQSEKPLELTTSGGNIELTVPADFKANLHAVTSGGRVECDLPVRGDIHGNSVHGKVNGGGPKVILNTSGGNIEITRLDDR